MSSKVVARAATSKLFMTFAAVDSNFIISWMTPEGTDAPCLEIFTALLELARARSVFRRPHLRHAPMSYGDEHDCRLRQSRIFLDWLCVTLPTVLPFTSHSRRMIEERRREGSGEHVVALYSTLSCIVSYLKESTLHLLISFQQIAQRAVQWSYIKPREFLALRLFELWTRCNVDRNSFPQDDIKRCWS